MKLTCFAKEMYLEKEMAVAESKIFELKVEMKKLVEQHPKEERSLYIVVWKVTLPIISLLSF
jgi:hypothetical protein